MYADYNHPTVRALAQQLEQGTTTNAEIVARIFHYVRDEILFGFHPEVDRLNASDVIKRGKGQCNNKSILFLALCQALDIPARIHFSDIDRNIHRGLIPVWVYLWYPKTISHSWLEIKINDKWHKIDSYINDADLFYAAKGELLKRNWMRGYSVADPENASLEFSLEKENFVQMEAVTQELGSYTDPAEYFDSEHYKNSIRTGTRRILARFVLQEMEHRVVALRSAYQQTAKSSIPTSGYNTEIIHI